MGDQEPIEVFSVGLNEGPNFSFPQGFAGLRARLAAQNDSGGINGAEIVLTECNDKGDTNEAAACAREGVEQDPVAFLASYTNFPQVVMPILEEASIPFVGVNPYGFGDLVSPMAFPYGGGVVTEMPGAVYAAAESGCTKIGIIRLDIGATEASANLFEAAAEVEGLEVVSTQLVAAGLPDYTPTVSTAVDAGADCLGVLLPVQDIIKLFGVMQQVDPDLKAFSNPAAFTTQVVQELGPDADGKLLLGSTFPPLDSDTPGMAQFRAEMAQYEPDAEVDAVALRGWTAGLLFTQIASQTDGPITQESFLAALNAAEDIDMLGVVPPFSATSAPIPSLPRLFTTSVNLMEVRDGTYVLIDDTFVDVAPAIEAAAS